MTAPRPYPIHPIAEVLTQIEQGENPWVALGNFLHDWWCYASDYRHDLIAEPPVGGNERWAAFCAATVEELCSRTSFPCPEWTRRPCYILAHPWFLSSLPSQREWLLTTTPEPFQRRNIFVGGSVLDNKYELKTLFPTQSAWTPWSDEELARLQS